MSSQSINQNLKHPDTLANGSRSQPRRPFSTVTALWLLPGLVGVFFGTAWLVYLAPADVSRYQCYALTFWFGGHATTWLPAAQCAFLGSASSQPALHLLPLEYPPLAVLLFSVPLLAPPPFYGLVFALLMLLIVALMYWLLDKYHTQRAARLFLLYLSLGASVLVQVRYDALPAACMLVCLLATERKRWRVAYSALALSTLLKLYPLVALPVVFLAEQDACGQLHPSFDASSPAGLSWRRRIERQITGWCWKHLLLFGSILAGVTGCFALLNPPAAVVGSVSYLFQRPTQIESLQSSLLWLAQYAGFPAQVVFSYGSLNLLNPLAGLTSWAGAGLLLLGCFFVFRLQWKHKLPPGQAMIALLCLLIATGKVFSPQYLIWLIPLVAYVGAARAWLYGWGAILVCTSIIYIGYYSQLENAATAAQTIQALPGFFEMVGIRNGGFCLLTVAYLFNWFDIRRSPP